MNGSTQPEPRAGGWIDLADGSPFPSRGRVIVSWARWLAQPEEAFVWRYSAYARELGVRIPTDVDVDSLVDRAREFDLIVLSVASFTDGRVFSLARALRERHGYRRELEIEGDVLADQVTALRRCGVDRVRLPPAQAGVTVPALSAYYQRTGSATAAYGHIEELRRRRRLAGRAGG